LRLSKLLYLSRVDKTPFGIRHKQQEPTIRCAIYLTIYLTI